MNIMNVLINKKNRIMNAMNRMNVSATRRKRKHYKRIHEQIRKRKFRIMNVRNIMNLSANK